MRLPKRQGLYSSPSLSGLLQICDVVADQRSCNAVAHACARAAASAPAVQMRRGLKDPASARHGRDGKRAGAGSAGGKRRGATTQCLRGRLLAEALEGEGMMRDDAVAADLRSFSTL